MLKMKRIFGSKHKKKKPDGSADSIHDSKSSETEKPTPLAKVVDSQNNILPATTKKKRNRKKKKSKHQKFSDEVIPSPRLPVNPRGRWNAPDGTSVVLRRTNDSLNASHVAIVDHHNYHQTSVKHIPGSECSSRTASSTSSSSSRWSARRPWSLVEPFFGQSVTESNDESDLGNNSSHVNTRQNRLSPPPSVSPPAAKVVAVLDKPYEPVSNRHRTFSIDFKLLRRFRRPSHDNKNPSTSPCSSKELDIRNSSQPRKDSSTKNKFSKHANTPSSSSSPAAPSGDIHAERQQVFAGDGCTYSTTESSIPEEQTSLSVDSKSSSQTSGSTDTVISVSEVSNRMMSGRYSHRSPTNPDIAILHSPNRNCLQSSFSDREEVFWCKSCQKRHSNDITCHCVYCTSGLSSSNSDLHCLYHCREAGAPYANARPSYITRLSTDSSADFRISESLCDLRSRWASAGAEYNLENIVHTGGSLQALPTTLHQATVITTPTTLPRLKCEKDGDQLNKQTHKHGAMFASSPQLNISCSGVQEVKKIQRERPKSSVVRFQHRNDRAFDETSESYSNLLEPPGKHNHLVESPIKHAIGFPGVVLRQRHQKSNRRRLSKSSSGDLLSRELRSKQAFSLNMEYLPTYNKMFDDHRWPGVSTNATDMGRARMRAAVLYQRYLSNKTSFEDAKNERFWLDQSIEDIIDLDDDEFLDLYLTPTIADTDRDSSPSSSQTSHAQEPSSKRVKTLRKSVQSFANLISPGKPSKNKIQRSSSFKESPGQIFKPYRPPGSQNNTATHTSTNGSNSTPGKRSSAGNSAKNNRRSKLWCETFDYSGLDGAEIKRQEAIFELYQGERIMVQDLKMAKQTYRDSMVTLKMLTEQEVSRIFGKLDCLPPLHENLLSRLEKGRTEDGRMEGVGHVFIDWFPTLLPYDEYCANQADAKETLDAVVSREARVRDFLQRCLESPFSRKLDLWSYLDLPRSRLVKYPLLLKAILKVTPPDHPDSSMLEKAIEIISGIISRVDDLTGERQANFVQSKLEYLDDKHRCSEVYDSRKMICSGQLKSSKGTKLKVFLFDLALVLARNATRSGKLTYQVQRQPLPLSGIVVETEEVGKLSGSFKSSLLNNDKAKHSFRVKSEELNIAYTLIAADEHDKKQWVNSLQEAISKCRPAADPLTGNRSPITRRSGSEKSVLDKPTGKPVTVKRSSSTRSEGSDSDLRYKNRGSNSTEQLSRKNSKEIKKMSKLSPLLLRRKSELSDLDLKENRPELSEESSMLEEKKLSVSRSRSVSPSPIAYLANLPRRSKRRSSTIARTESFSKPPSGRFLHNYSLRSSSRTPPRSPRSPRLPVTRSMQDLSSYPQQNETLEDVKKRLAPVREVLKKAFKKTTDETSSKKQSDKRMDSLAINKHAPSTTNMMLDSPDHPAASCTSQHFPIVEEDPMTPRYKSLIPLHTSASSPSIISIPGIFPSITWATNESDSALSSSSESLQDVKPIADDVTMIEENDQTDQGDGDVTPTGEMTSQSNTGDAALDVLNEVVRRVSTMQDAHESYHEPSCSDYVTITSDEGLRWRGDDIELSV